MSQGEDNTDSTLSESLGTKHTRGTHPRSLANLRPPWRPGDVPNPTGRSAEGLPSKTAAIQRHLEAKLASKKGKKTWAERVVDAWVEKAAEGDPAARRDLLDRTYPVPQDEAGKRVILEGLKLELTPGGGASVSMIRGEGIHGAQSFADQESKESYGGTALPSELPGGVSMPLPDAPPPLLEASDTPTCTPLPGASGGPLGPEKP